MSLLELVQSLQGAGPALAGVLLASPLVIYGWGRLDGLARVRRSFGHTSSVLVALGLITLVFATLVGLYLNAKGYDLVADVHWLLVISPLWFGFGNLFAATRTVPFAELRRYPMLRRVWSLLSAAALLGVAFLVLRHTYWLVFSGIFGFIIVAVVAWTAFQLLFRRGTEPPPEGGDSDLLDEVADLSRRRVGRFADRAGLGSGRRDP